VERTQVGLDPRKEMHRVGVLEENGMPLHRNERAADERAEAVDGHRRCARRVPDVGGIEQEAGLDIVLSHGCL
jgi:hypothetical protein